MVDRSVIDEGTGMDDYVWLKGLLLPVGVFLIWGFAGWLAKLLKQAWARGTQKTTHGS